MLQLELFKNNIEEELATAIIYLRKQIRACEKNIYKTEKEIIIDKQHVCHVVALNPDGTINLKIEGIRRKLNKVYSLRKEGLHHLYKAYFEYQENLESLYEYLNLNMRLVCDWGD